MKLFLIATLIFSGSVFAAPLQASQEINLIYALYIDAPEEVVGKDCFTVLTVASQEYVVECDGQDGTPAKYDMSWNPIKKETSK